MQDGSGWFRMERDGHEGGLGMVQDGGGWSRMVLVGAGWSRVEGGDER